MTFDFSEEINKQGTHCLKWEFIPRDDKFVYGDHADPKHGANRMLPMWVADMDFRCPPAVVEALMRRAEHGVFGYSLPDDAYYGAVIDWFARRYGRVIERDWIMVTPGVVPSLNMMLQAFVRPGEKVLIQPPVYHPFFHAIENNEAVVAANPLLLVSGRYEMDFADLEKKVADPAVKVAILCSPHNPIGRVWTREELTQFGEICMEHDVLVISDEIHGDLIYPGVQFTSYATLGERFEHSSIVCSAASKSFNLAGLKTSNIIIPDPALREKFQKVIKRNGLGGVNTFGLAATQAAYNHCAGWLQEVMAYIAGNYEYLAEFVQANLPQLDVIRPEGTYLLWVNFRRLGLSPEERKWLMLEEARLLLDEGEMFGAGGEGFERFNIACPRSILEEALARIEQMVSRLESAVRQDRAG